MRRAGLIFLLLLLLLCAIPSSAYVGAPADSPRRDAVPSGKSVFPVNLGESSAVLTGPWKFHTGDDLRWSLPGFDDSNWSDMDLTPPPRTPGVGWTKLGYPGYSGYAWYRLRVNVEGANHRLALKMPDQADDAYQVFVNGQLIGDFGKFTDHGVTAFPAIAQGFPLPKSLANGTMTIAIRMWMDSATPFNSPDAGGLHGPPTLAYASVVRNLVRLDYDDLAHYIGSGFIEMLI